MATNNISPAYFWRAFGQDGPCICEPLRDDDTKGWQVVKRRVRKVKVKTDADLEEEANLDNWEDVEHYGKATYAHTDRSQQAFEHNGALFDIGSRF